MVEFMKYFVAVFLGALLFGVVIAGAKADLPIRAGEAPFSPLDPKRPRDLPAGMQPKSRVSPLPTSTPLVAPEPPLNWRDKPVPVPSATGTR